MDGVTPSRESLRAFIKLMQVLHTGSSDPDGAKWCKKEFVGLARGSNVLAFAQLFPDTMQMPVSQTSLREECRACCKCKLGRE